MCIGSCVGVLSIASTLPEICVEGSFCSRLSRAEYSLSMIVGTIIVVGYSLINAYCTKAAIAEDERDNQRINQDQRSSKNRPQNKWIMVVGRRAHCSIMLCAGANLLYAFMELSKLVAADKGIIVRGLMLFDVMDPFLETILIVKLSRALVCLIPVNREWSKESFSKDAQICIHYFNEYTSFYENRRGILKGLVVAKVGECAAPYVIPHASVLLRNAAPTLYQRVFG